MSIPPREIWSRLTPALQEEIINELQTVLSEVIYDYIRTSNPGTSESQSNNLHSSINSTPINQQPGKSASTILLASASDKPLRASAKQSS